MTETQNRLLIVTGLVVLSLVAAPFAGIAAADHGSPANFTVYPETTEDRSPSSTDSTYVMSSAGADAFDSERGLETIDHYWIESDQARFTSCDPDNARTLGIDRDNDNTGTQTDVDLLQHMKNYNVGNRRITLELYDDGDLGGNSVNLNAPDATIAVLANCVENTGEPGWYQFQGYVNGTAYDGSYEEVYLDSHYFWIGDYEDEAAAREELGAPPSEDGGSASSTVGGSANGNEGGSDSGSATATPTSEAQTPTPTAAVTATDAGSDDIDDGSTDVDGSTPAPETSADDTADTGDTANTGDTGDTATDGSGSQTNNTGASSPSSTGNNGGDGSNQPSGQSTPTANDGPGFGVLVTMVALLAGGLLTRVQ